MPQDRVRDGRDLMQQDEPGMFHPAARFTFSESLMARFRHNHNQREVNRAESARLERVFAGTPDHPNYRYQRTGEDGV